MTPFDPAVDPKRRALLLAAGSVVIGSALPAVATAATATWTGRQFHNQPAESHVHAHLVELWARVADETGGRLVVTVFPQNGGIAGSDPAALDMLQKGELEFFVLMGGILGRLVPVAEIQGLPFAFTSHEQVHKVFDGELGAYIGRECAAKGIYRFQYGLMENGFRQIGMIDKPIAVPADLADQRIRVPDGEMFRDLFASLGAKPVTVNISGLYDALKERKVDGQENPLVVTEFNKLYEVSHYQSITNHMWSGFNLLANASFWKGLPDDVQQIVFKHVRTSVAKQRADTDRLNRELETTLATRGQHFNKPDAARFRAALGDGFYARWKARFGPTAWNLLEAQVGKLG
jgi:TRAP-type transport system periplasmic protein